MTAPANPNAIPSFGSAAPERKPVHPLALRYSSHLFRDTFARGHLGIGYKSAHVARTGGSNIPQGGSADRHLRTDLELLRRQSAEYDRNNLIYESVVSRFVDMVLGPCGFKLRVMTGSRKRDTAIEKAWKEFCKAPEISGRFSFQALERLALRAVINDGDIGVHLTNVGKFEYIEAERIWSPFSQVPSSSDGPRIEQGVELDQFNKHLSYRVVNRGLFGDVISGEPRTIKAKDFVFPAYRKRISQTRGVPVLVSAFPMIERINDVCDSEAVAYQLLTKMAFAVKREGGPEMAYANSNKDLDGRDPAGGDVNSADMADRFQDVEEGIIFHCEPGESIEGIDRNIPGPDFSATIRMFLRLMGLPLGLPLEVMLLDYSQTNYSSARASLEQAYRAFIGWQAFLKREHHSKLFSWWLSLQVAAGKFPDRETTFKHEWDAPEFPWIDPLQEAEAWGMRIDRGLATQASALSSISVDRADWLEQRVIEVDEAIVEAKKLNDKYEKDDGTGPQVDWRMFAGVEVSRQQGIESPSVTKGSGGGSSEDEEEKLRRDRDRPR